MKSKTVLLKGVTIFDILMCYSFHYLWLFWSRDDSFNESFLVESPYLYIFLG